MRLECLGARRGPATVAGTVNRLRVCLFGLAGAAQLQVANDLNLAQRWEAISVNYCQPE